MPKTVEERVKEIISSEMGITHGECKNDAHLTNDLDADSLDIVEIAMALEEEFDIEVPDEKMEEMATVQDVIDLVEELAPNH